MHVVMQSLRHDSELVAGAQMSSKSAGTCSSSGYRELHPKQYPRCITVLVLSGSTIVGAVDRPAQ